jgi:hypothetical protein
VSRLAQLELALGELRRSYDRLSDNADRIDQKAAWLLNSSNIIVGLFGLLQLTLLREGQPAVYWIGVVLLILSYVGVIWVCIRVLAPRPYRFPITSNWAAISKDIIEQDTDKAYAAAISSYVEHIPRNRDLNEEKARQLRIAAILLAFIIVLLVCLGVLPR